MAPPVAAAAAVSKAAISTAATVASTALTAVAAISQGQAQKRQAEFQATVQRQQAERERQQAEADEQDFRRRQALLSSSRRAALGASGVEGGEGSPLLVSEDFAGEAELQALRLRSGGELRATRLEQSAQLQRLKGRNAQTGGFLRAGSSLLSGAGTLFSD